MPTSILLLNHESFTRPRLCYQELHTSTLIGIAIDQGAIESVEQPVLDFFPERSVANLDADKEAMTLEDLLTMRSRLRV